MDALTEKSSHRRRALELVRIYAAGLHSDKDFCKARKPLQTAADTRTPEALNYLALRQEWPLLTDRECRFDDPRLHGMHNLWSRMAENGIPFRQEMTVRLLQPYIPQLSIFERVYDDLHGLRYRVRLMGTNMVQFTTEMTGRYLDEVLAPQHLQAWLAAGQTVLQHGAPLRLLFRGDSFQKKYVVGEAFAAPLRTTDGRPDLVMAVVTFAGLDPWDRVAARVMRQLGFTLEKPSQKR